MHKNLNYNILSIRELQILNELNKGKDIKTIALNLCITEYTINAHIKTITRKMKFAGLTPVLFNLAS